jgi:hypothetical protein
MTSRKHRETADWIIDMIGQTNPYRRNQANLKSEYYIYQMGFLASYMASLIEEDPFIARRFARHIKEQIDKQRGVK